MSIKLHELSIKAHNGKLVIGKLNKRGRIKDFLDISTPILHRVIKCLTTKRDETFIYQEIIDPETKEVKHFKITCYEMTPEEVSTMKQNEKIRAVNAQKGFASLMGIMLSSFGRNSLNFH